MEGCETNVLIYSVGRTKFDYLKAHFWEKYLDVKTDWRRQFKFSEKELHDVTVCLGEVWRGEDGVGLKEALGRKGTRKECG